jgi:hypothetical protein
MTPEGLHALAAKQDISAFVEAVAPLDENERMALWPAAEDLLRQALTVTPGDTQEYLRRIAMYQLGYAAFGSRDVLLELDVGGDDVENEAAVGTAFGQVLADRKPPWLDQIINRGVPVESLIVLMERGCVPDLSTNGVLLSVASARVWNARTVDQLIANKELLDAVYRFFEIELRLLEYLGDRELAAEPGWPKTMIDLCDKGHLDRTRLARKIIEGLAYDFNKLGLKGMMRLHDLIAIDDGIRKSLEDEYFGLLGSTNSAIVGFALRQLKALGKAKLLDRDVYVSELPRVFQCSAKNHPKTALTLLKTVVKQQASLRDAATLAAAEGLTHAHEDVQDAAMTLVEGWANPSDARIIDAITRNRDHAAAPVQLRVDAFLAKATGGDGIADATISGSLANVAAQQDDWQQELASRLQRIDALPAEIHEKHGFDEIFAAAEHGLLSVPTTWHLLDAPLLSSLEAIQPIETLDELFDTVAHCIEKMDNGDDVERILDGISRLCDQRPNDFQRRADPLVHRITKTAEAETITPGLLALSCDRGVVRVLMAWLTGDSRGAKFSSSGHGSNWRAFMVQRLRALSERVEERIAAPLLAAPTHRGGWIDPEVWAERVLTHIASNVPIDQRELMQSFLRLTPDGRTTALAKLESVESPYRTAIIWALGGEQQGNPGDHPAAVWIAASRCRDPEIKLTGTSWPKEPLNGPSILEPGRYTWKPALGLRHAFDGSVRVMESGQGKEPAIEFELLPRFSKTKKGVVGLFKGLFKPGLSDLKDAIHRPSKPPQVARHPTALSHLLDPGYHPKWVIHWSAMVWPSRPVGYWACAVDALLRRFNMKPSTLEPHSAYLDPLFETDRPLTELSALALWIATLSKDSDSRTAAIDLWTEVIADGRGDANLLGAVLIRISEGGWLQLNRLGESLREVSRISSLHAWTVAELLQDQIKSLNELPRDSHHVLQLLRELLVQLGLAVRDELQPLLSSFKGSGKTAKLAREVSQLVNSEHHTERQAALLQMLDARLDRAERWTNRQRT